MYTVYLAGPMTNRPGFNFPQFFDAEAHLNGLGWDVKNPARKDLEKIPWDEMQTIPGFDTGDLPTYVANSSFTMANAMEWDLPAILNSDGIVLLPEWYTSTGARYERTVAEALDRDVWVMRPWGSSWDVEADSHPKRITEFLRDFSDHYLGYAQNG